MDVPDTATPRAIPVGRLILHDQETLDVTRRPDP